MVIEILAIVAGGVLLLAGIAGCILPVLPGPLLALAALFVLSLAGGWGLFSSATLILWSVVALGSLLVDAILPARAAARAGANRGGVWGSVVGMLLGTVLLPPLGVFLGAFVGALAGEIIFHRDNRRPLISALAVFRATVGGIVLKLAVSGAIGVVFVRGAIRLVG